MSFFDKDLEEMLDVYLLETSQLIEKLDEILLEAEQSKRLEPEDINSIFRIMHTTKSSSAVMGLGDLSDMAHKLEDLFSMLRDAPNQTEMADKTLFELLFSASDFIKEELGRMKQAGYQPEKPQDIELQIGKYLSSFENIQMKETVCCQDFYAVFLQKPGIILKILFEENCKMENVRAFMLMKQVKNVCQEAECYPENPEKKPETEKIIRDHGFLICIQPQHMEQVLDLLRRGLFVAKCEIQRKNTAKPEKEPVLEQPAAPRENSQPEDEFLNVKISRLDRLQDLTGELMLLVSSFKNELADKKYQNLEETFMHRTDQVLTQLENTVLHMRMVPVASIVPKLKRVIRDISRSQKKEIDFEISGQEVEADKNIVDHLFEASMHILRNAADHGIETPKERENIGKPLNGKICFTVESTGEELVVSISDDGKGMNEKRLRQKAREKQLLTKPEEEYSTQEIYELSTLPGLSTNKETNEYSGRGVGMDIVRKLTEDMGGHLHIASKEGQGTTVTMYMPFTHTIVESIRFYVGKQLFSVSAHQVYRFFEYSEDHQEILWKNGRPVVLYEDRILPIIDLAGFYDIEREDKNRGVLIYVKGPSKEACLLSDGVAAQEKIVIKPLPALLGDRFREKTGMNGCSVSGNGSICMSLDIEILIRSMQRISGQKKEDGHEA